MDEKKESSFLDALLLKVLTLLVIVIGAMLAILWQGVKNDIGSASIELRGIDKRIAILEQANVSRAESIHEQRETLKQLSSQIGRIEKGLIRKRVIEP